MHLHELSGLRQQGIAQAVEEQKRQIEIQAKKRAEEAKKQVEAEAARKSALLKKYGEIIGKQIIEKKIWIGMTDEMARESLGTPNAINRTVTAFISHEQWVYGSTYLYFENGILTSFQTRR